ncbi:protein-ER retention protein [Mortierella sp. GBA30]|nr:protein-ER retention protein [Mortierella sp. GBA30]
MDIGNIFEEWDFSGTVPLPYRVLLMGCIGIFAWASNVHILSLLRVDVSNLLFSSPPLSGIYTNHPRHTRDKFSTKPSSLSALYRSIYTLGMAFLAMVLLNMWMYKWVVAGSADLKDQRNPAGKKESGDIRGGMGMTGNPRAGIMVPILGYMTVLLMVFIPFNVLFKKERYRFLRSIKKALFSRLKSDVSFSDVILADILTSFARVFGDLAVALCLMFWDRDGTNADACYGSILVPIMTSIPYCIRLRQCLSEYIESNYTTQRHLMNALKYASAFPVIIISSLQKAAKTASLKGVQYDGYLSDKSLFRLWLFFVALNSFYSFYWDIYHDWSLIQPVPIGRNLSGPLPSPTTPTKSGSIPMTELNGSTGTNNSNSNKTSADFPSSDNGHNYGNGGTNTNGSSNSSSAYPKLQQQRRFGMRSFLHYEDSGFYIMAVVLDFLLRTTWMLKLVSNIQIEEYEGGVFMMECLEVLRRWIWVLFRLESEMVKRAGYLDPMSGMALGANGTAGRASVDVPMAENNVILMEDLESWQK